MRILRIANNANFILTFFAKKEKGRLNMFHFLFLCFLSLTKSINLSYTKNREFKIADLRLY